MPINDPIKNRKVAPASLAFERDSLRNGATFQVGTTPTSTVYQDVVNIRYGDVNQLFITNQYITTDNDRIMGAMTNAEERAKHQVADYKRTFQWDLKRNQAYTFNAWSILGYDNEVIRAVGCSSSGTPVDGSQYWDYTVPNGAVGTYWVYAHLNLRLNTGTNVGSGHLAFFINGSIWRIVDQVDNAMMGDNKIIDLRVAGGCHVPLQTGDKLTVRVRLDDTAGSDTSIYPTSVYSYVTGHREKCDYVAVNAASTGQLYTFNKDA